MRASRILVASAFLLGGGAAFAQTTIKLPDLQLEIGGQRSYLTHQSSVTIVTGLIMQSGGPRHWDFSNGVDDETFRYEILPAEDSPFDAPFPDAELAELLTVESDGDTGWTFYNLTPAGRELHGFYDPGNNIAPDTVFAPPIVDYPATIDYLDQWSESTFYRTALDIEGTVIPLDVELTITSIVDAYGTITLPNLGTVEVLRVNELSITDSVADVGGTPFPLGQTYVRSYLWLSKEYGLVAQITSDGSSSEPPPNEFEVAARFLRLSTSTPPPVPPVLRSIVLDAGNASVIVTWASVPGKSYQLEVSDNLRDWNAQGDPVVATGTETFTVDGPLPPIPITARYYRVRRLD